MAITFALTALPASMQADEALVRDLLAGIRDLGVPVRLWTGTASGHSLQGDVSAS